MSRQDRRVEDAIRGALGLGVDAIADVLPEPARAGLDIVRGNVERTLGGWVLDLLDELVASGVVVVTAAPTANVNVKVLD